MFEGEGELKGGKRQLVNFRLYRNARVIMVYDKREVHFLINVKHIGDQLRQHVISRNDRTIRNNERLKSGILIRMLIVYVFSLSTVDVKDLHGYYDYVYMYIFVIYRMTCYCCFSLSNARFDHRVHRSLLGLRS